MCYNTLLLWQLYLLGFHSITALKILRTFYGSSRAPKGERRNGKKIGPKQVILSRDGAWSPVWCHMSIDDGYSLMWIHFFTFVVLFCFNSLLSSNKNWFIYSSFSKSIQKKRVEQPSSIGETFYQGGGGCQVTLNNCINIKIAAFGKKSFRRSRFGSRA